MLGVGKRAQRSGEFEALLRSCLDALYSTALRMSRDPSAAEDLVQEVSLRALGAFHTFQPGTNFKAWVFRILTNTFINQHRRAERARALDDEALRQAAEAGLFGLGSIERTSQPEQHLLRRFLAADVLQAIATLPVEYRLAVELVDLQDFSYREVADILEVPVGTVMSRLFRGRQAVRCALTGAAAAHHLTPPISDTPVLATARTQPKAKA